MMPDTPDATEFTHYSEDDEPQLICPVRGTYCNNDLCPDYGCALKHGLRPDRDEAYGEDWT